MMARKGKKPKKQEVSKQSKKGETKIGLKLLIDRSSKKVVFAESGKGFVDFIIHMMSLPLGSVVKLLNHKGMVGCLSDLYKSVESLNPEYFQSNAVKNSVLNPKPAAAANANLPLLLLTDSGEASSTPSKSGGIVKGVVMYMVMDNLEVKPMSTISAITFINKFHVNHVSSFEEKQVLIGLKEGLAILKASLETKAVLTSVFHRNKQL